MSQFPEAQEGWPDHMESSTYNPFASQLRVSRRQPALDMYPWVTCHVGYSIKGHPLLAGTGTEPWILQPLPFYLGILHSQHILDLPFKNQNQERGRTGSFQGYPKNFSAETNQTSQAFHALFSLFHHSPSSTSTIQILNGEDQKVKAVIQVGVPQSWEVLKFCSVKE